MDRPEHSGPAALYYNQKEADKYSNNIHMIEVQSKMTERALQLIGVTDSNGIILDIGCGSGISGSVLTDNGYYWVGIDISQSMLDIANSRDLEGDLMCGDIGQGLPFRPGMFDYAVSISAIQWLCTAEKTAHNPYKRLHAFFQSLFSVLTRGAKCAFQFYPEGTQQIELISNAAMKCGFNVGLIVDYPNSSKARKYYLYMVAGWSAEGSLIPNALTEYDEEEEDVRSSLIHKQIKKWKPHSKSKDWIKQKKDVQRMKGMDVKQDSKYTGRRRHNK